MVMARRVRNVPPGEGVEGGERKKCDEVYTRKKKQTRNYVVNRYARTTATPSSSTELSDFARGVFQINSTVNKYNLEKLEKNENTNEKKKFVNKRFSQKKKKKLVFFLSTNTKNTQACTRQIVHKT